jgi:teichuronic acid biosynthesis protein TuaE
MKKTFQTFAVITLILTVFDSVLILPIEIPPLGNLSLGRICILTLLLIVFVLFPRLLKSHGPTLNIPLPLRILIVWTIYAMINLILSPFSEINIKYFVNLVFNMVCLFTGFYIAKVESLRKTMYNSILYITMAFAYIDLILKWRPPAARQWDFTNEIVGAFSNPLYLGYVIAFYVITICANIIFNNGRNNSRNYFMLILILPIVPFVGSRTLLVISALTLAIMLILLAFSVNNVYRSLPIILLIFAGMYVTFTTGDLISRLPEAVINKFSSITLLLNSEDERGGNSRFIATQKAIQLSIDAPILGYGTGAAEQKLAEDSYLVAQGNVNPHNFWLELLLNYGLIGTIIFVSVVIVSLIRGNKIITTKNTNPDAMGAFAYLIIFPFLVIGPSSINNFAFPWITIGSSIYLLYNSISNVAITGNTKERK